MLYKWSLNPSFLIKTYELTGFYKLSKKQKCQIYIYCYYNDFKNWIKHGR